MTTWLRYPDVVALLVTDLEVLAGPGRTGTVAPADLETVLPWIRVTGTSGPSDKVSAIVRLDIDCFAATYGAAEQLAEQVRQRYCGPGRPPIRAVDAMSCDIGPRELPWNNGSVRRFETQLTAVLRRRQVPLL